MHRASFFSCVESFVGTSESYIHTVSVSGVCGMSRCIHYSLYFVLNCISTFLFYLVTY